MALGHSKCRAPRTVSIEFQNTFPTLLILTNLHVFKAKTVIIQRQGMFILFIVVTIAHRLLSFLVSS